MLLPIDLETYRPLARPVVQAFVDGVAATKVERTRGFALDPEYISTLKEDMVYAMGTTGDHRQVLLQHEVASKGAFVRRTALHKRPLATYVQLFVLHAGCTRRLPARPLMPPAARVVLQ